MSCHVNDIFNVYFKETPMPNASADVPMPVSPHANANANAIVIANTNASAMHDHEWPGSGNVQTGKGELIDDRQMGSTPKLPNVAAISKSAKLCITKLVFKCATLYVPRAKQVCFMDLVLTWFWFLILLSDKLPFWKFCEIVFYVVSTKFLLWQLFCMIYKLHNEIIIKYCF